MGGQGSGPRKSKKDAKEKADEQSQRMRERRAEESRAEAEATAEQMRRHHRPIDSFFSRGAAAATAAATAATAEGSASSSTASGVRETGASPGEATDARRVGASLREDEEEDRSFNETARELEQLHMAVAVQNSLRDQQQGTRSARIGAGTTDEPDSTSTLRGSNPQRLAALTSLAQSRSEDELRQTLRELYSQVATGTSDDLQAIPEEAAKLCGLRRCGRPRAASGRLAQSPLLFVIQIRNSIWRGARGNAGDNRQHSNRACTAAGRQTPEWTNACCDVRGRHQAPRANTSDRTCRNGSIARRTSHK